MQVPRPRPRGPNAVPDPGSVGVAAPLGRDARLIADRLRTAGVPAEAHTSIDGLCDRVEGGHLGTLVLTAEAVTDTPPARRLRDLLRDQPLWSDIPVLVLGAQGQHARDARRLIGLLSLHPSATVLERPVPSSVLVAAARLAMTARERQIDVRNGLAELERAKQQLEARVEARTREVRRLASDLTLAEHAERRRIAHLLHDDLQQRLHGLSVTLTLLGRAVEAGQAERAADLLERAERTLSGATSLTRSLSHEMSPPLLAGGGVSEVIEWATARAGELYGLRADVEVDPGATVAQEDVRVLLSQILGELLFNVAKHAGVSRARVSAHDTGGPTVRVVVEDEGVGFDPVALAESTGGLGLASTRERAELIGGRVEVESAPGRGTRVVVEVPSEAGTPG